MFPLPSGQGLPGRGQSQEQATASDATTAVTGGVGEQLRAAREGRKMSVPEVAQALKLGPRQVEALEAEDWKSLPGNTMIRGFVRNYARLLNIDAGALMRGLDAAQLQQKAQLEASAGTTASLPHSGGRRVERRDYLAVLSGLALLGLAVLAYFYIPPDLWQSKLAALVDRKPAPAPVENTALPSEAAPGGLAAPRAGSGESVTVLSAPHATVLSDAPVATSPASGAAPRVAGGGLKLSFAQPAWVEIRDARGQVLLSALSPAGSQREVDGQPPFSLVVGNSTQVTVQYRGRVIELAPHSSGDVARLTVE
jgi:cytoskeleton protein RodZ